MIEYYVGVRDDQRQIGPSSLDRDEVIDRVERLDQFAGEERYFVGEREVQDRIPDPPNWGITVTIAVTAGLIALALLMIAQWAS